MNGGPREHGMVKQHNFRIKKKIIITFPCITFHKKIMENEYVDGWSERTLLLWLDAGPEVILTPKFQTFLHRLF